MYFLLIVQAFWSDLQVIAQNAEAFLVESGFFEAGVGGIEQDCLEPSAHYFCDY